LFWFSGVGLGSLLEKEVLHQVADILKKYGIDSEPRKCCLPRQLSHLSTYQFRRIDCKRVDNLMGVTDSESDDSKAQEIGEHESDKDCEVIGGNETVIEHDYRGNTYVLFNLERSHDSIFMENREVVL
jgi:hypothetical protein